MQTKIDGVTITLTDEQVKHIRQTKAKRRKRIRSFESVLMEFGFKKRQDIDGTLDKHFGHPSKGWWAEIYDDNRVWMVGKGLKCIKAFPGGYMYHTPEELIKELEGKA